MTMADFEASGLFSETKVATKRVSPVEEKLLGLLHAGRHIEFFELAVQSRLNILISGATGSGKTTFSKGPIGRASSRESVWQYGVVCGGRGYIKKKKKKE